MKEYVSKVIHEITSFARTSAHTCAGFVGEVAASYRAHRDADNKRIAAEARFAQEQQIRVNLQPEYDFVAEMLMEAINNGADVLHFSTVPIVERLKLAKGLVVEDGIWVMVFRARRFKGYSVTASDAQRILQSEMDCVCEYNNYTRLVLRVIFGADGAVRIKVACAADLARRHAEKVKEVL